MLKTMVIGNIGQNAKINDVNGQKAVNFSVAHNEVWKDKEGTPYKKTVWINCTRWIPKNKSTKVAQFLTKGTLVFCEGVLSARTYVNNENKTAISYDLTVFRLELLSSGKKNSENDSNHGNTRENGNRHQEPGNDIPKQESPDILYSNDEDDLPF
jgi:single-strand DNA-binding protein